MSAAPDHKWRNTILAGLANYIDAGSIVAGSVALGFWKEIYGLSDDFIGLIGAFSANAISAGVGALIGGILCDKFGRKKIYQYDMIFYAFGMLFLVFASAPWMIVLGFVLVGLAVGAHSGVAQLLWYLGPVAVLVAAYFLQPWGITGIRWLFAHLAVLAIALTFLRSRMRESQRWEDAQAASAGQALSQNWRELFKPAYLGSMLFLASMYGLWNLWAGFNGFFTPYLIAQNNLPAWTATMLPASYFLIGMFSIFGIFMTLSDKVSQRMLFGISAVMHVAGMSLLAIFGYKLEVVILHVVIMGIAGGFGAQSFFQLWSAELFPTAIRSTAQGATFAVVRIGLGIWSFAVPALAATDFTTLAWILTGFLVASGVIGMIWAPRNQGKSLEAIAAERGG
jgi:MFS transporter, SP family, inositol transporter